jgi:hypothetical protein
MFLKSQFGMLVDIPVKRFKPGKAAIENLVHCRSIDRPVGYMGLVPGGRGCGLLRESAGRREQQQGCGSQYTLHGTSRNILVASGET